MDNEEKVVGNEIHKLPLVNRFRILIIYKLLELLQKKKYPKLETKPQINESDSVALLIRLKYLLFMVHNF